MPESFAALAVDAAPIHHQPPVPARNHTPPATSGRLRETFENDLVLKYLDLAEALAARFEARGRERADLNQVAYLGLVKAARGFDQAKGESFPAYAAPTTVIRALNDRIERDAEIERLQQQSLDPYVETRTLYLEMRQREIDALRGRIPAVTAVPPVEPAVPQADTLPDQETPIVEAPADIETPPAGDLPQL